MAIPLVLNDEQRIYAQANRAMREADRFGPWQHQVQIIPASSRQHIFLGNFMVHNPNQSLRGVLVRTKVDREPQDVQIYMLYPDRYEFCALIKPKNRTQKEITLIDS
jgi:hypothetical protein